MKKKSLRKWLEENLVINIPEGLDDDVFLKGFVAGVQDERERIKQQLREIV